MTRQIEPIKLYRWTHKRGGTVEAVECFPTGKRDYFFVLDEEDVTGGTAVYGGSLFDSAEACWDAQIREAERRVKSSEDDLADLRRQRERAISRASR